MHERLVEKFGGPRGVRDAGLLESALFRPQTGYYRDLAEMGTALFESLLMNHPFVDGNKRVAFFATDVFFRLNGFRLGSRCRQGAPIPDPPARERNVRFRSPAAVDPAFARAIVRTVVIPTPCTRPSG